MSLCHRLNPDSFKFFFSRATTVIRSIVVLLTLFLCVSIHCHARARCMADGNQECDYDWENETCRGKHATIEADNVRS